MDTERFRGFRDFQVSLKWFQDGLGRFRACKAFLSGGFRRLLMPSGELFLSFDLCVFYFKANPTFASGEFQMPFGTFQETSHASILVPGCFKAFWGVSAGSEWF